MPASFSVGGAYGLDSTRNHGSSSPYWIVVVVPLGQTMSFSRAAMASTSKTMVHGAMLRAAPLVITDDCLALSVSSSKRSHTSSLQASLKMTNVNYLTEILPGDWVMGWMVANKDTFDDLLVRLGGLTSEDGLMEPCNEFNDGLKFVGRVASVRMHLDQDPESGIRQSGCALQGTGFGELDSQLFYDRAMESAELRESAIGRWMLRLGIKVGELYNELPGLNNINKIVKALLDLIIGAGPGYDINTQIGDLDLKEFPQSGTDSPYAYLVPALVGQMLGVPYRGKATDVTSYADILELLQGVQKYPGDNHGQREWSLFIPKLADPPKPVVAKAGPIRTIEDTVPPYVEPPPPPPPGRRRDTSEPLLGTFMPLFESFVNEPLWKVLEKYINPTINEIYTCMRVNPDGLVMPTIVFRQIPFTTEAFTPTLAMLRKKRTPAELEALKASWLNENPWLPGYGRVEGLDRAVKWAEYQKGQEDQLLSNVTEVGEIPHTKFVSEMPRWKVPASMIYSVDIGRGDATRCNFVHIFGRADYSSSAHSLSRQLVLNKPIRDDLDIMRSGLHSYMTTVDCAQSDQTGKVPTVWMSLVADWMMGSHLTLTGTMSCAGIQAPICEGDNVEFDGVVYHIEGVSHQAGMHGLTKRFMTTLQLTNGMRADSSGSGTPIYPGLYQSDNTGFRPGLSLEQSNPTVGGTYRPGK